MLSNRPVTIVVPLAAGSGVDLVARVYGEQLAIALESLWWSKPHRGGDDDRHQLRGDLGAGRPHAARRHKLGDGDQSNALQKDRIRPEPRDFVPINYYLKSPFVLCVHPTSGRTVPN